MLYKIILIQDLNGNDKRDEKAIGRIGRVISIDPTNIVINKSLFMRCVKPGFYKSLITSPVSKVDIKDGGLVITTRNSRYVMIKEGDKSE